MAGAKDIKNRIVSVKNTRKITRTMEMVATAKSKRMSNRVNAARPYSLKVGEIMRLLGGAGDSVDSPLLRKPEHLKKVALLTITANRGLCGGYNSNTLRLARETYEKYKSEGVEVVNYVIGKKGRAFFKFNRIPFEQDPPFRVDIDDLFTYEDSEAISEYFMDLFAQGEIDRLETISMVYHSSARQTPEKTLILPVNREEAETETGKKERDCGKDGEPCFEANVIYEPSPNLIMETLLPLIVKTAIYRALLEAVATEQIFRRIAMKNATDSAGEMIKILTMTYNRKRQAAITQEISEIVAGADSVG